MADGPREKVRRPAETFLRPLRDEDLGAVAQLWHDSWASTGLARTSDPSPHDYRRRLEAESRSAWRVFVAIRADRIEAFLAIEAGRRWLRQLFVHPRCQSAGLGSLLLSRARSEMSDGFWLRTDADNTKAQDFYLKKGLQLVSTAPHPQRGHRVALFSWRGALPDTA